MKKVIVTLEIEYDNNLLKPNIKNMLEAYYKNVVGDDVKFDNAFKVLQYKVAVKKK